MNNYCFKFVKTISLFQGGISGEHFQRRFIEGFVYGLLVFEGGIGGLPPYPATGRFTGDRFSDVSSCISSTVATCISAVLGLSFGSSVCGDIEYYMWFNLF